jgi:hypothetical protein
MIGRSLIALALLGSAPALAADPAAPASGETRIPRMGNFLEWIADGERGLYIRGDTGRWYYARTQSECPRLDAARALRFDTSGNGDLDRFGAIRAEGWRCQLSSVVESAAPLRLRRR